MEGRSMRRHSMVVLTLGVMDALFACAAFGTSADERGGNAVGPPCASEGGCEPAEGAKDSATDSTNSTGSTDSATPTDGSEGGQLPAVASCLDLPSTCGASGQDSCCASTVVSGGTYKRSYDNVGYKDPSFVATVDDFRLDRYEVTVGRFRAFKNAKKGTQASPPAPGAGAHPKIAGSGWDAGFNVNLAPDTATLVARIKCNASYQTWTDVAGANEAKAMNCITWYEAFAFCIWDGGRVPTEAEWNYAAAGGGEQRVYPWGGLINSTYAVYSSASVAVVGSKSPTGDGKWGHADLAGNLWEWTLDWFRPYGTATCNNCADLVPATGRVLRGGAFVDDMSGMPSSGRATFGPEIRYFNLGIRCARTP
jgi:formylglycine-generating enzyme